MRANRRRDTKPELAIRRILHAQGFRYRVDYPAGSDKRRRADIVFTRQKVAVFIDGCFWHGCPEHATIPKVHSDYWIPKLMRNRERDVETSLELESEGWTVLRFWEHDDPVSVAAAVSTLISHVRDRAATPAPDQHDG